MSKFDINKALNNSDDNTEIRIIKCKNKEDMMEAIDKILGRDILKNDIDKKVKQIQETSKNMSDKKIFKSICDTFGNVVNASNRKPAGGVCSLLDDEGNLCVNFINIETNKDRIAFLETIIGALRDEEESKM